MPDPVWYYARGDVERGPFTIVQIKALANAGKLRRDDLIWKEGMESWTAAGELTEIFASTRVASEPSTANDASIGEVTGRRATILQSASSWEDFIRLAVTAGRGCLFVGLSCVVLARGCESVGERRVARLRADATLHATDQWQRQREPLVAERDSLTGKENPVPADKERLREITQSLNQLDASRGTEQLLAEQHLRVFQSIAELRAGGFQRDLTSQGGIAFLVLGGFTLAILGTGSERWLGTGTVLVVCATTLASPYVR